MEAVAYSDRFSSWLLKETTMKATWILMLLLMIFTSFSCRKDDRVNLMAESLTTCPPGSDCRYLFLEHADVNTDFIGFTSGSYRLFWSVVEDKFTSTRIYIKAPMADDGFVLGKSEILAGRVKLIQTCMHCNSIYLKPVDGYVKGTNVTPDKPADQTKWFLEIKLYLESEGKPLAKDTINVSQYFHPNFVYN